MRIYLLLIACLAGATWAESIQDVVEELESFRESLEKGDGSPYEDSTGNTGSSLFAKRHWTHSTGGSVYIRWGRKSCPGGAELVYSGVAGGTHYSHPGGGSNYLCLPNRPQWGKYEDGLQGSKAYVWGAEYQLDRDIPFPKTLHDNDVTCAVCAVNRGMMVMIPARNTCPNFWTKEYDGYLMADYHGFAGATEFVCVDKAPQASQAGHLNQDGALFYPVEARCGSLPCPNYVEGRELTCVVCTN